MASSSAACSMGIADCGRGGGSESRKRAWVRATSGRSTCPAGADSERCLNWRVEAGEREGNQPLGQNVEVRDRA
ncbi:hypothetical protein BCR44DRAFT_1437573 [Catenaria anguillulae PL171]|uniref:Uncharacterized protein n=1 Tax=Catenaria anguillulae PL171 TaxID=765915 RepID=A0A1Y2HGP2_9FUNG|nr:hypothetical protein BCR44DRAFT_1437573 [Catenaria anguillulae PL171]